MDIDTSKEISSEGMRIDKSKQIGSLEMVEEEKKVVYLVFNRGFEKTVWYKINLFPKFSRKAVSHDNFRIYGGITARVGSILYLFGGLPPLSNSKFANDIFFSDSNGVTLVWQKHQQKMISKRKCPIAISINKKVYLFGSNSDTDLPQDQPWAEVFDTDSGSIHALAKPPPGLDFDCGGRISTTAVINNGDQILLAPFLSKCIYLYNVKNECWTTIKNHPLVCSYTGRSPGLRTAVVGNILYTFTLGKLYAFDLEKNEWFDSPVDITRGFPQVDNPVDGFVHHLGNGKLCIVFVSVFTKPNKPFPFQIHYITLGPVTVEANSLQAKIRTYHMGFLVSDDDLFVDSLAT